MTRRRRYYRRGRGPEFAVSQILIWADMHRERTGQWPKQTSGLIMGGLGSTWTAVDLALRNGRRGLPGGSSLAQLLAERRGYRNRMALPELPVPQILDWADAYRSRTGKWPTHTSGPIPEAAGETWSTVHHALRDGSRGLPGRSSLAQLLADHRGRRTWTRRFLRPVAELTVSQILVWADQHRERTGQWPRQTSGLIRDGAGSTWTAVDSALRNGLRGLPGGSSLAQLLAERRGYRNPQDLDELTVTQILGWSDLYRGRNGKWPTNTAGPIAEAPGETWNTVDRALRVGSRGLPAGSSLARLLAQQRGRRNRGDVPRLTVELILSWADAHYQRTGQWPKSGVIPDTPSETWGGVNSALKSGVRGLPGGSSLARLLARHRQMPIRTRLLRLNHEQILTWADAHYQRAGQWPTIRSGAVAGASGFSWLTVDAVLRRGLAGLPAPCTLARFLSEKRAVRYLRHVPRLTLGQILGWAESHRRRTGRWPTVQSGPVYGVAGETWKGVNSALGKGGRGLRSGCSLAQLLAQQFGVRNHRFPPLLTVNQILSWADQYRQRMGRWPTEGSGSIADADGETWKSVNWALRMGRRGLAGASSLAQLLAERRDVGPRLCRPPLTLPKVLAWANAHYRRHGRWPSSESGRIPGARAETWRGVDHALRRGGRGLPAGSSLSRLLKKHRRLAEAAIQLSAACLS